MTSFADLEDSLDKGRIVRLYRFFRGGLTWLYTTHTANVTWQQSTYTSTPGLSDDGLRQTGQATADAMNITAPADFGVAQLWRGTPPGGAMNLTIYDAHWLGDQDSSGIVGAVAWAGQVTDVKWTASDRCRLTCQSLSTLLDRQGLRLTWQRECPHAFGDKNCGADVSKWQVKGVISAMTGSTITASALRGYSANWFTGGWLEWSIGGGETEARGVEAYSGTTVTLTGGTGGLNVGDTVYVYPGCPGTTTACINNFDNINNFGGCPIMPGKSPFDGEPLF